MKEDRPKTLYQTFLIGERQPKGHGMSKGLDKMCAEVAHRNSSFRDLVRKRQKKEEDEIITLGQASKYYPKQEVVADHLFQVANAFHKKGIVRAKSSVNAFGNPNIYHQKDVADIVKLFGGGIESIIVALHHDDIEDLPRSVYEMDQFIRTGRLENDVFTTPYELNLTTILPRVINLTNMMSPISKEIARQTIANKAYSREGMNEMTEMLAEGLHSPQMLKHIPIVREGLSNFWYNARNELEKNNKSVNEKNRVVYMLDQLQGTFFNYDEHMKYLSGAPIEDIGIKAADRTENAGNDRNLTKHNSFKRIRSGGKSITFTEMIDKVKPISTDKEYFGIEVMKYAILERTFERFRRKNYANPYSRIELRDLPTDEAERKISFYQAMTDEVLKKTRERFDDILAFKNSDKFLEYIKHKEYR